MGRSRVTDDQLREAAATAHNLQQLLRAVGLVPCGANYAIVRSRLARLGLLDVRFHARPSPVHVPLGPVGGPQLSAAVAVSSTYAGVLRALGRPVEPRHYRPLRALLRQHGLSTEHFVGQGWARGTRRPRTPLADVLVAGRPCSSGLGRRLVEEGVLAPRCSGCGGETWQGEPIPLELDHIDGNRDDNGLENLRLLCPNCHALTDTWRGRNKGRRS